MTSQSLGGFLGAIIAAVVLVAAVDYGPIGQFGKPAQAGRCRAAGTSGANGAGSAGTGDPGRSELAGKGPLRIAAIVPILPSNGDVDA